MNVAIPCDTVEARDSGSVPGELCQDVLDTRNKLRLCEITGLRRGMLHQEWGSMGNLRGEKPEPRMTAWGH
jgi:hypothetical protein